MSIICSSFDFALACLYFSAEAEHEEIQKREEHERILAERIAKEKTKKEKLLEEKRRKREERERREELEREQKARQRKTASLDALFSGKSKRDPLTGGGGKSPLDTLGEIDSDSEPDGEDVLPPSMMGGKSGRKSKKSPGILDDSTSSSSSMPRPFSGLRARLQKPSGFRKPSRGSATLPGLRRSFDEDNSDDDENDIFSSSKSKKKPTLGLFSRKSKQSADTSGLNSLFSENATSAPGARRSATKDNNPLGGIPSRTNSEVPGANLFSVSKNTSKKSKAKGGIHLEKPKTPPATEAPSVATKPKRKKKAPKASATTASASPAPASAAPQAPPAPRPKKKKKQEGTVSFLSFS